MMLQRCISIVLLLGILLHSTNAATYTFAKWFLAGSFNGTSGATNVPTSANVVGLDISKNQYFGLGTGTDKVALSAGADQCGNVYFAGQFSTAGNTTTGPVALWKDNTFQAIAATLPSFAGVITSIYVDCPAGSCDCDLWIGGSFMFTASNSTAMCVARYSAATKSWSALGGAAAHNLTLSASTVPLVTTVKRIGDTLYVGGSFPGLVKSYTISSGVWSSGLMPNAVAGTQFGFPAYATTPIIHDMRVAIIGSASALYVGGNFNYAPCNFVCGLIGGTWSQVGGKNQPNGPVFGMAYDNSSLLYIVGNFSGLGGSTANIAVTSISADKLAGSDFGQAGAAPSFALPPVYKIEALDKRFGYNSGSYGYSVLGGLAFFYDADVRIHFPFGTATFQSASNIFASIVAVPYVTNSAYLLGASMPLIFMCMTILMFFYSQ